MIFNKTIDYQNISLKKYISLNKSNKIILTKDITASLILNNHCNGEFLDDYINNEDFIKYISELLREGNIEISPLLLWNNLNRLNIENINQKYLIEIYKLTDKTKEVISDYVIRNIDYDKIDKIFYKQRYFIDELFNRYKDGIFDNEYISIKDKVRLINTEIKNGNKELVDKIPNNILEDDESRLSIVKTLISQNIFYKKGMNKLYEKENDYIRVSLIIDPLLIKYLDNEIPLNDNILNQIAESIKENCCIVSSIPDAYKKSDKIILNLLENNPKLLDTIGDVTLNKMNDKIPLYKNYEPNYETPITIQNRFDYLSHFIMKDIKYAKFFWSYIPKTEEEKDFINSYYNARKKEIDDLNIKLFKNEIE